MVKTYRESIEIFFDKYERKESLLYVSSRAIFPSLAVKAAGGSIGFSWVTNRAQRGSTDWSFCLNINNVQELCRT